MPDQQQPQPDQNEQKKSGSSIRTMKSDVEELFRSSRPSVAQMIGRVGEGSETIRKQRKAAGAYLAIGIFVLLAIILGGGGYYAWTNLLPTITPKPSATPLVTPAPFFATESTKTIAIPADDRAQFLQLMEDAMKETERVGTIRRIVIRLQENGQERYATIGDFLEFYHIDPPRNFLQRLDASSSFMPFVYFGPDGSKFGMAVRTRDTNRTLRDMLDWEGNLPSDLGPLFFGQKTEQVSVSFEDRTYRNIDWRYASLSKEKDLGIGYTVFPAGSVFVLTTSRGSMEVLINRLFDAR